MSHATGKFIAVILAIWLPLFSGNALAVSLVMQTMSGGNHSAVMQHEEPASHCVSAMPMHHVQPFDDQGAAAIHQDMQKNSGGEDCGTCHLACCGYMAAASIEVMGNQPSAQPFPPAPVQFKSCTPAPLDPPPLARA